MTRDEIIKELKCLASGEDCPSEKCDNTCPYWTEIERGAALYDDRQLCHAAADMLEQDAKTGWISVKDKLPDEEEEVLLLVREVEHYGRHAKKGTCIVGVFTGWRADDEWATTYCNGYKRIQEENEKSTYCEHTVTHWMPLPEPPKEAIK